MTSDPEGEITPVEELNDRHSGEALKIPTGVPEIVGVIEFSRLEQ